MSGTVDILIQYSVSRRPARRHNLMGRWSGRSLETLPREHIFNNRCGAGNLLANELSHELRWGPSTRPRALLLVPSHFRSLFKVFAHLIIVYYTLKSNQANLLTLLRLRRGHISKLLHCTVQTNRSVGQFHDIVCVDVEVSALFSVTSDTCTLSVINIRV